MAGHLATQFQNIQQLRKVVYDTVAHTVCSCGKILQNVDDNALSRPLY